MSFNNDTLARVATDRVRFFTYTTTDSRTTVTGSGYFGKADVNGMNVGDRVEVTNSSSGDAYTVEITSIASSGGATGKIAERMDSTALPSLTMAAGSKIVPDNAQGTAISGAVTINKVAGVVTSESLTTAAGADYTLTITNSKVAANAICLAALRTDGSNAAGTPRLVSVTPGSGSLVIVVHNDHASAAFNGTLKIAFYVLPSA